MISWKGNLVPSLSTIVSLSVLNNVELCYRGTGTSWSRGGFGNCGIFLAHNYVSEQFGNYVEYGIFPTRGNTEHAPFKMTKMDAIADGEECPLETCCDYFSQTILSIRLQKLGESKVEIMFSRTFKNTSIDDSRIFKNTSIGAHFQVQEHSRIRVNETRGA